MKKTLLGVLAVAAALSSLLLADISASPTQTSALALANIEALSDPEGEGEGATSGCEGICHRIVWSQNCYRSKNGVWEFVCVAVRQVQEYKRISCVEVCNHYSTSGCPSGTVAR